MRCMVDFIFLCVDDQLEQCHLSAYEKDLQVYETLNRGMKALIIDYSQEENVDLSCNEKMHKNKFWNFH